MMEADLEEKLNTRWRSYAEKVKKKHTEKHHAGLANNKNMEDVIDSMEVAKNLHLELEKPASLGLDPAIATGMQEGLKHYLQLAHPYLEEVCTKVSASYGEAAKPAFGGRGGR